MDWNTKWDYENFDVFNSKYIGIGESEEDIDGSFNVSDVANNSSTKSSISASTESSFKEGGVKRSNFSFEGFQSFNDSYNKQKDFEKNEKNGSVCSGEPFIGLKLGKRTYFENNYAKNNNKTSLLGIPVSTGKKIKSLNSQNTPVIRCQVEGCNLDLSSAKEYHRKHRVCECHSKSPKVIVAGHERRFCQQCSRFHSMSEFDEEKRSCRKRLSDHNARRRKPQQETIRFNSSNPYSTIYDTLKAGIISSSRENICNSKYSVAPVKAENFGNTDLLSDSAALQISNGLNTPTFSLNKLVPPKGVGSDIFDQDFKEALTSSNVDAVELRRALSLLSNNSSWVDPTSIAVNHIDSTGPTTGQPVVHHGLPTDYYLSQQQSTDPRNQIFKSPYYENSFMYHHPNG